MINLYLHRLVCCCKLVFMVVAMVFMAAACTVSPVTDAKSGSRDQEALSRAAVVAIGAPRLDRTKPSTISWKTPVIISGADTYAQIEQIRGIAHTAIQQQIMEKGYPVLPAGGDFQLSAVVVIDQGKAAEAQQRSRLFDNTGIDPGLNANASSSGRGSLVIELTQGLVVRWRGAVQIYILPQLSAADISRRINYAVSQLLATWP